MERRLFTSESVTEGHPDKICDQISDAILDALMEQDPMSRVACETCTTTGMVLVMGEISTKAIDLRGMIGALKTIKRGLKPTLAINMGITGKTFDVYEKEMVSDIIRTRIPEGWESSDIFPND